MHAEAFAGAASEQRSIHRTGTAPVHALLLLGPEIDALDTGIALHHAVGVVIGVVRQRLDRDEIAGIDLDARLQRLAEIAPMHGVGVGRQMMIGALRRLMFLGGRRHLRRHQRDAAGGHRRGAAGRREARAQERAAFPVERLLELAMMPFEVRAVLVVTCAHLWLSLGSNVRNSASRGVVPT